MLLAVLLGAAGCGTDNPPAAGGPPTPPGSTGSAPAEGPASPGRPAEGPADPGGPAEGPADPGGPAEEPAGPDGAIPGACALLRPAEIESAIGAAVGDGEPHGLLSFGDQTACAYPRADDESAFVLVLVNGTGASFEEQRRTADVGKLRPSEDVAGVGDDAYWIDDSDTVVTHVGDVYLQVTYTGGNRRTVADLVRVAVAKL
jgi:hypothetical protein